MPRTGYLGFGLLAYLVGPGSMVYLVGFLVNRLVPKGIDAGPRSSALEALAVDVALLASFAVVHSLLARPAGRRLLARLLPAALERSAFSLIAGLQLVLLYWQWRPLPGAVWAVETQWARSVLLAAYGVGWLVVLAALRVVRLSCLFGFSQAWRGARGLEPVESTLEERGIYRVIRHPLYSGTILALWAAPEMSQGRLLMAVAWTLYMLIGQRFEERELERRFGEPYREYRRRVPAFVPRLPTPRREQAQPG